MIRFLFRFVGLWLLAGAFIALVIDGTRSIAASRFVLTPVAEAWFAIHPSSIDLLRSLVERNLSPWLWEKVFVTLLLTPLWALLIVFGVVFVLLGRPPARPIGYSSRD
jgi:hypothetical protein